LKNIQLVRMLGDFCKAYSFLHFKIGNARPPSCKENGSFEL